MTYDEWIDTHRPVKNHLDANASFEGRMFETFGDELQFVRDQPGDKIWTLVSGDEGDDVIVDGYSFVNRLGYFITEVPHALDTEVILDD